MSRLSRAQDLILPLGMITSILVIIVPMPPALMDVLLAANITVAVIVLLTTILVRTPLEFSVFPSLLLATTLARLVLNVATTRLILTRADTAGLLAAGGVVRSFGEFVAGDRVLVGLIIFAIIVVIQFVVITKGATRISEVAARFALDGMPGRQMAIDADLGAGVIDQKEAQRRRDEVTRQADFYGAMDGASKFVRGDAIAGLIITIINIAGGLAIGVLQADMSLVEAGELFTKLTIGDGLVSQVPAFLIALAAGLLVTRSTRETNLPVALVDQLFSYPQAMAVTAGFLGLLVFTSLPTVPLVSLAGGCVGLSLLLARQDKQRRAAAQAAQQGKTARDSQAEQRIEQFLAVDPMEIEIGVGLVRLADPDRGGDLLSRITTVRRNVAAELGIVLPKVRIRDNLQLAENAYRIKIANNVVADGNVYSNRLLVMAPGITSGTLEGIGESDPAFGQPAVWIDPHLRDHAEMLGYRPLEGAAVLAAHLAQVVRTHADELLTRDATKHLVQELKKTAPAAVEELIPGVMKLSELQQVLQMLLREQVPIRQLALVLETLGDNGPSGKDPIWLTEQVRQRLARTISWQYRDRQGQIQVVTLDPSLEEQISGAVQHADRGLLIRMSPGAVERICALIADGSQKLRARGRPEVLLVSPHIRPAVRQLTAAALPQLVVLSYHEVTRETKIEAVGMVSQPAEP
jgi:flagellar biosynthesis protein FlhA